MRNLLLFSLIAVFTGGLSAQDENVEYIIPKKDLSFAFYISTGLNMGAFEGDIEASSSFSAGFAVNKSFYFGTYMSTYITQHKHQEVYDNYIYGYDGKLKSKFAYSGIQLKYLIKPNKAIHFGFSGRVGPGQIKVDDDYYYSYMSDLVGVFSPQVDLEMNIMPRLKLNLGVGYRYVFDVTEKKFDSNNNGLKDKRYFESNDFNTPYGTLNLVFVVGKNKTKNKK